MWYNWRQQQQQTILLKPRQRPTDGQTAHFSIIILVLDFTIKGGLWLRGFWRLLSVGQICQCEFLPHYLGSSYSLAYWGCTYHNEESVKAENAHDTHEADHAHDAHHAHDKHDAHAYARAPPVARTVPRTCFRLMDLSVSSWNTSSVFLSFLFCSS